VHRDPGRRRAPRRRAVGRWGSLAARAASSAPRPSRSLRTPRPSHAAAVATRHGAHLGISPEDIEAMKRIEPDWPKPSERNRKPRHQQGLRNNKYSQGQKVKKQRCPKPRKQSSTRS